MLYITRRLRSALLAINFLGAFTITNTFWVVSRMDTPCTVTLATPTKPVYTATVYPRRSLSFVLTTSAPLLRVSLQSYHGFSLPKPALGTRSFSALNQLKTTHQQTTPTFLSSITSTTVAPAAYEPLKTVTDAYTLLLNASNVKLFGPWVKKAAALRRHHA